jgi:hypothetical protein
MRKRDWERLMHRLALILVLLYAIQAFAQEKLGPHGGLLGAASGGHQAELVLGPTEVTVYILEKGKAHETAGAKMRVVIQQSGKTATIDLADQQGKRLTGKLDTPIEKGAIVVVTGKDKHGDVISARYVIK